MGFGFLHGAGFHQARMPHGPFLADRNMVDCYCNLRVLIVAEHASSKFGGEAALPLHYFRFLRRRGVEAWLVVHSRTRDELLEVLGDERGRIEFIPDTGLHRLLFHIGQFLPSRLSYFSLEMISRLSTQFAARRIAKRLIDRHGINVVHQPIPVSPREPSVLFDLGIPVVIGPMNGGMKYPPAFRRLERPLVHRMIDLGRKTSTAINRALPGKLRATVLLVANERTEKALPSGTRGEVMTLVENGVDLTLWGPDDAAQSDEGDSGRPIRFAYVGRLVDWKCVDLLLEAFSRVIDVVPATLDVYGDGEMRGELEVKAIDLGLEEAATFHGWISQSECARRLRRADGLVLPSMYECGGAVVLEAMASGLPVIATNWGGPADYLDESCGILIDPESRESFVAGLVDAMIRLAKSPVLREAMGRAGRYKSTSVYNWEHKIDRIIKIYKKSQELYFAAAEGGVIAASHGYPRPRRHA